jgi:uncharacterized iron-regulated membrane protein
LAGIVILVMSVTGVLLTYERQMVDWAERGYRSGPAEPGAPPLGAEALVQAVRRQRPAVEIDSITRASDPSAPVELRLGRSPLFVDPYTGRVLGEGATGLRGAFGAITAWHRWLGASGDGRSVGRAITGACNLAFLFLVLSGIYIWWPRPFDRRRLRAAVVFDASLRGKARDFNWHNSVGIWLALPLAAVVASGAVISYPWARDLLYSATGSEPPPRRRPGGPRRAGAAPDTRGQRVEERASLEGLDRLWSRAAEASPGWQSIRVRLPLPDDAVSFAVDRGHGARPDLRTELTLHRRTGRVLASDGYEDASAGRRLQSWLRWIHTGEAGGVAGQTLAGLASAGAALLVWTGVALAWRRFVAWRRRAAA